MYSSSSFMSASISPAGRFQFSWLKAKSVRTPTPAWRQPSTTSRTAFIPAWWPSGRGSERPWAQRPLPSMMMAMWPGTAPCTRSRCSRSLLMGSDFQNLRFFGMDESVDELDMLVGELLYILLGVPFVVLRDLFQLLDAGERVGAGMPDCDPSFLPQLVDHLDQILPAFLRQGGQRHPDQVSLGGRVESQIGVSDSLLDGLAKRFVEGLNREQAGLGSVDHRDLIQRYVAPVGLDSNDIEQRGARLAAADGGELPLGALHRLVHQLAAVFGEFRYSAHRTMVPTRSPWRTRVMAPG